MCVCVYAETRKLVTIRSFLSELKRGVSYEVSRIFCLNTFFLYVALFSHPANIAVAYDPRDRARIYSSSNRSKLDFARSSSF